MHSHPDIENEDLTYKSEEELRHWAEKAVSEIERLRSAEALLKALSEVLQGVRYSSASLYSAAQGFGGVL